ncbi:DUF3828 domain-containing protein [Brevundimonas sp.]|uniref:DUF3828 domain-containing protein n=1 Tax=Brevundimonas sp. TaxID=1871086 RepID=UPI00286CEFD7|nr:DUF3828 domain-containing protein [Brevundimonas sp.]
MMKTLLLGAAAMALAACSAEGKSEAEAATTATAASAATDQSPDAYVRALYGPGDLPEGDENALFSARTRALIEETEKLTPEGFVGFFEAQPICDCQDGTPVLDSVTAVSTGPDSADVAVVQSFAEPGNAVHRKTYRLVREGGQWKIDDMTYQDMGEFPQEPLVQRLKAWIAEVKADPNAFSGE